MRTRSLLFGGLVVTCLVLYPILAFTRSNGAPAESTGAPRPGGGSEPTCSQAACHHDGSGGSSNVNTGIGQVTIEAPDTYVPGQAVEFVVRVEEPGMVRFGFQVAVKDIAHNHVGTLEVVDANTTHFAAGGRTEYVTHSLTGAIRNEWPVRWVAPDADAGPVTIYAAGNAANGNGSALGDHIYTTSKTLQPQTATAAEPEQVPGGFVLHRAFPNPATAHTTVRYELDRAGPVVLTLYDALGRRIRRLDLGTRPAGLHEIDLDTGALPPGRYVYEVRVHNHREVRPLLVLR